MKSFSVNIRTYVTMKKLKLLSGLMHLRRERYRKRYYELMNKPVSKWNENDRREFFKLYDYFDGDIDSI